MPDTHTRCGTCIHWMATSDRFGSCRERPPAAIVIPAVFASLFGRPRTVWPRTHAYDWCGAWVLDATRLETKQTP